MNRTIYLVLLIVPMVLYYLLLNRAPDWLATGRLFGWPLSLLFGVMTMFWGVFIAALFALKREESHEE